VTKPQHANTVFGTALKGQLRVWLWLCFPPHVPFKLHFYSKIVKQ